jgi:AcrR family transcriptional regulator
MKPEPAPVHRGARPPGRGAKVRAAILAATMAELADAGYAGLTIDNVARRSGVHKTTIYRRWKDREALVTAAVTDFARTGLPFPDTKDIGTDLRRFARGMVTFLNSPVGRAVPAAMLADAARVPEIAEARRRFFEDRFRRAEPVVAGAIERGELPVGTDAEELIKTILAPICLRLLVTAEPIDQAAADRAAAVALAAARAGVLRVGPVPVTG